MIQRIQRLPQYLFEFFIIWSLDHVHPQIQTDRPPIDYGLYRGGTTLAAQSSCCYTICSNKRGGNNYNLHYVIDRPHDPLQTQNELTHNGLPTSAASNGALVNRVWANQSATPFTHVQNIASIQSSRSHSAWPASFAPLESSLPKSTRATTTADGMSPPEQFGPLLLPLLVQNWTWWGEWFARDNLENIDSDGDGLTDLDELFKTGTSAWHPDSDVLIRPYTTDGVSDAMEDPDEDGLVNCQELRRRAQCQGRPIPNHVTDPLVPDTDGDGLNDLDEYNRSIDPTLADTDGDELTDDSEVRLGTDPDRQDSDFDGIPDGQDRFTTSLWGFHGFGPVAATSVSGIDIELTGIGDTSKGTRTNNLEEDLRFQNLAGQMTAAFEITTTAQLESVRIKLSYDLSQVPDGDVDGLGILRYDKQSNGYEHLGQDGREGDAVWIDSTQVGIFVLVHMPTWQANWNRNEATLQSISTTSADVQQDTDEDGLSDSDEVSGFLDSSGNLVYTDPNEWDTDGDGLSDSDEIGELVSSDSGDHYEILTDPNQADGDNDGLNDLEELGIGTEPSLADTDFDTLLDGVEADIDFDPLDANPDGDHRRDDVELEKGSDPYYFNPTALVAAKRVVQGALLGDFGENLVDGGWLVEDTFVSLSYMSGWVASGFVGVGDIRDTSASLIRLDAVDTLLNALAFVPAAGDALKIGKIVDKVVSFAKARAKNLTPILRWVTKNFEGLPGMDLILGYFGYSDEAIAKLCQTATVTAANDSSGPPLLEPCASSILERLGKARNRPNIVNDVVAKGGGFVQRTLSSADWTNIKNRANSNSLWGNFAGTAEARAVEAAKFILENTGNYDILYTQRRGPLYKTIDANRNEVKHFLLNGPDMVAVNRTTGETVVIEIKGKSADHRFNSSTFSTPLTIAGVRQRFFQPELGWLATKSNRYLNPLRDAVFETGDQLLEDTLLRLEGVAVGDPYEAVVFGFVDNQFNKATFGKLDRLWTKLNSDALRVDTYLFDRSNFN